jgi:hypothetical protein
MPMQTQQHDPVLRAEHDPIMRAEHADSDCAQLEHYESGDGGPGSQRTAGNDTTSGDTAGNDTAENAASEGELMRYDEEEVATKPWPPLHF